MENQKKRVIDEEERPAIGQGDARPMRRRVQIFFFFFAFLASHVMSRKFFQRPFDDVWTRGK